MIHATTLAGLPSGYSTRPATVADADTIHQLVAAAERDLHGRVDTEPDRIAADLTRAGLDPALDTLLVFGPDTALAGRAWVNRGRRAEVDVHPDHRGRGIGGALLHWVETRARQVGSTHLGQTVSDLDRAGGALLRFHGYQPAVTSWLLEIATPDEPVVPDPPAGITVRPFRTGDEQAVHQLTEDAFDEWQQRRKSYPEWASVTVDRAAFAPAVSPLAFAGDELVGAVLAMEVPDSVAGHVDRVAVRRDHRDRGIARLLLRSAFRGFYRRGRLVCTLWTHSDTGALALYERTGMTVRRSATVYRKALGHD